MKQNVGLTDGEQDLKVWVLVLEAGDLLVEADLAVDALVVGLEGAQLSLEKGDGRWSWN